MSVAASSSAERIPARSGLILASTSRYRRELLQRLRLPFSVESPQVDETALPGETPSQLALRLAAAKARAVAQRHPTALVIGSDQAATLDDRLAIGKPGSHENAVAQLRAASGRTLRFFTAVSLQRQDDGFEATELVETRVRFRRLDEAEIERYLRLEQPYDCAGAAKAEGLGIALLEAIDGDDPTAIIGLPLIALGRMLRQAGCSPLAAEGDGAAGA
ncbi:MAG: Maf family nucleotide pyrophosphatase, partial [Burkholderiaceae bacterium]